MALPHHFYGISHPLWLYGRQPDGQKDGQTDRRYFAGHSSFLLLRILRTKIFVSSRILIAASPMRYFETPSILLAFLVVWTPCMRIGTLFCMIIFLPQVSLRPYMVAFPLRSLSMICLSSPNFTTQSLFSFQNLLFLEQRIDHSKPYVVVLGMPPPPISPRSCETNCHALSGN
jgi:hypothetical protein